jgi:uncharacterized membrane protein (DUF2068 family)
LGPSPSDILIHWARAVRVDPDNAALHSLIVKLTGISPRRLAELSFGTFLYGALFATEGAGLLLRKRWAEYVTTLSTTLFLPIEVYELIHKTTVLKAVVLLANIAIVFYLTRALLRTRHQESIKIEPPTISDAAQSQTN